MKKKISRRGFPDFMKHMSDERLAELSDPNNFIQRPIKINWFKQKKTRVDKAKKIRK